MKKLIGLLMVVVMVLGLTACGAKKKVEGTWLCDDGENGYRFSELGKTTDGEKMGFVTVLPKENTLFSGVISYYYRFLDKNTIEIIRYAPNFSGNAVSVDGEQYDVLTIEKEDGKRVLFSEITGEYYYQDVKASFTD